MRQVYPARHAAFLICLMAGLFLLLSGCDTEATRVNRELTQQAEAFSCERRITFYNSRTDKLIVCIEGYMSLDRHTTRNELIVTCKIGEDSYKKNYISTPDDVYYVMEDINGVHTDPYHYKCIINADFPPGFELLY